MAKKAKRQDERIPVEYGRGGVEVENVGDLKRVLEKIPDDIGLSYHGEPMRLVVMNNGANAPTDPFIALEEIE